MSETRIEERTDESAEAAIVGVRIHALVTLLVSIGLVVINVVTPTAFPWAVFPVIGMAAGVWLHWFLAVHRGP